MAERRNTPRTHGPGVLGAIGFGLAGLVVTPFLTMFLGWLLYGHRDTWNVGQGDSFLVFFVALFATPVAAVYWVTIGLTWKVLLPDVRGGPVNLVALVAMDARYA